MNYEMQKIIGKAIGKAFLSGAHWMLDAQHEEPMLGVAEMDARATVYTRPVMDEICAAIALSHPVKE